MVEKHLNRNVTGGFELEMHFECFIAQNRYSTLKLVCEVVLLNYGN